MKILYIFNHPAPYKVKFLNMLCDDFDIDVIFERDKNKNRSPLFYNEKNYKFNIIKISGINYKDENFISFQIKKIIKKNKYDFILINGYTQIAEMDTINYLKRKKIPYGLVINGGFINHKENFIKKRIKKHFLSGANIYFSPDENSNAYLNYYAGNNIKIINYPYSSIYEKEILLSKPLEDEKKYIVDKYKLSSLDNFISAGQLIKRKNILELIQYWHHNMSNYNLIIVGDGKEKEKIKKYINKNNIKNIRLINELDKAELFELYKICKGFIFPTSYDIYGHVVNEAMSQGLPVISSKNANASLKLIKDKYNGFLLNDCNDSLCQYIDFIKDNDLFFNCSNTSKDNTIEKMCEAFKEVLTKVNI